MTERVLTVALLLPDLTRSVAEEHLAELEKLVETAGGTVVAPIYAKRNAPDPSTYVGSGKAEELGRLAAETGATLIVFDDDLSPAQLRNLEKTTERRVIDRSALILDIFASRARSREARTQVELAQLEYMLPRLTRQWSHLERQAGGIGTRGVGETQLELDRRIIRKRISRLKEDLRRIEKNRETQRRSRESVFTVALVGYTNAGKSTLFNRLTAGNVEAVDRLFATLDAKSQRVAFPTPRQTVAIDTVGFIRKLPHHLVASFRSTMEEAVAADLVLHVVDQSHPQFEEQRAIGEEVLAELGVDPSRVIDVYNKADRFEESLPLDSRRRKALSLSALTGQGIDALQDAIRERELQQGEVMQLAIPHAKARLTARLHQVAEILDQKSRDEVLLVTAWVPHEFVKLFEEYASTSALRAAGSSR
ncbi:MAG TPA: GTPase HflX [Thermoanaerobaculia bacterium]|nr:GTPase HflX [Thermoanaerobaculia bacterium]